MRIEWRSIVVMLGLVTLDARADGRLLATGGASQVEGQAGGGLVPWAVLAGYGTREQVGATAFRTRVELPDYRLDVGGAAFTWANRVEVSVARQRFDLGTLGKALGMPGAALRQTIVGAKIRLFGDVVYDALPQVSLGIQQKHNLDMAVPFAVGARRATGTDVYLSATQVLMAQAWGYNLLWNLTVRSTDANQFGLLGFGGDRGNRRVVGEGSVAVLFRPGFAVGAEYRQKPDHLAFAREDRAADAFIGWFANKHVSLVLAWADLGAIAGLDRQRGAYLSVQASL